MFVCWIVVNILLFVECHASNLIGRFVSLTKFKWVVDYLHKEV